MNRLERISSILVKLQTGRVITAQEISDQFDISLRTVYRDMKALEESGVPLYGSPGIGFSLVDGYRLPPLSFTTEEATSFLTAGKFIDKMTDNHNTLHFNSGLDKIRAVMRYAEKDYLEGIEKNIAVVGNYEPSIRIPADSTMLILRSITQSKAIEIGYTNKAGKTTVRRVEPVGCMYNHPNWHLIAWCTSSRAYRNFRIDRITHISTTEESFSRKHPSLKSYIHQHRESGDLHTITINVIKDNLSLFEEHKYPYGYKGSTEHKDRTEYRYQIFDIEHFMRWFKSVDDIADMNQYK